MSQGAQSSQTSGLSSVDVASLLDPACYPHPTSHLLLRETPISWVLLTGTYAYKIKKPVQLDFIDAATLPRRRFLCEEELRLNRRFAPDLYHDVVAIGFEHGRLRIGATGAAAEYAVRMQQFDGSQELASLLAARQVQTAELAAFGAQLAQWHQSAAAAQTVAAAQTASQDGSPAGRPAAGFEDYGTPAVVRAQVLDNFPPLRRRLQCDGRAGANDTAANERARLRQLEQWTLETLTGLEDLMTRRARCGRVRECHGDLHSGNVVRWGAQLLPFDCLEFDPRLRWIDAISDVAFLFMDLQSHARADLAYAFVSAYLEHGGDYEGMRLLRFYGVYRALVRAKVDALAVAGRSGGPPQLHRQHLDTRLRTATRLMSAQSAALVLMHGVAASGKSWLSERLISLLPAIRVRSDLERKRLPPEPQDGALQRHSPQRYDAAATQATYTRLLECAASALEGGHSVLIDATFLDGAQRLRFEALAEQHQRPWLIVSCHASRPTLLQRLAQRAHQATDPSEATAAVLDQQLQALQPLTQSERTALVQIDMDCTASIEPALLGVQQRLRQHQP